jgi:hypothetical protein
MDTKTDKLSKDLGVHLAAIRSAVGKLTGGQGFSALAMDYKDDRARIFRPVTGDTVLPAEKRKNPLTSAGAPKAVCQRVLIIRRRFAPAGCLVLTKAVHFVCLVSSN